MNKYQEALEDIECKLNSTDVECYICKEIRERKCNFDYVESIMTLKELVEKEEKHRWHDLRKNPDDLPIDGSKVLVKIGHNYRVCEYMDIGSENEIGSHWRFEPLTFYEDEEDFLQNMMMKLEDYICGWKHIEEFEIDEKVQGNH